MQKELIEEEYDITDVFRMTALEACARFLKHANEVAVMAKDVEKQIIENDLIVPALERFQLFSDLLKECSFDSYQLVSLWNVSECNVDRFERNLAVAATGTFSKEEMKLNLLFDRPVPFVDEDVNNTEGIPLYGELFQLSAITFHKYCVANKEAFDKKVENKEWVKILSLNYGCNHTDYRVE